MSGDRGVRPGRRRGHRRRSGRVRAILSLGIVLGLGGVSTMAFWTDTATVDSGALSSGRLDLLVDGNLEGQGGSVTQPNLTIANMVPGESVAVTVSVQRAPSTVGFTYTATASATGTLATHLRWTVTAGSAGTPQVAGNGIRTNTCGGATLFPSAALSTVPASPTTVIGDQRSLSGATMSENICIRVALPADAPNAAQSSSATASFVLDATNLTP